MDEESPASAVPAPWARPSSSLGAGTGPCAVLTAAPGMHPRGHPFSSLDEPGDTAGVRCHSDHMHASDEDDTPAG